MKVLGIVSKAIEFTNLIVHYAIYRVLVVCLSTWKPGSWAPARI